LIYINKLMAESQGECSIRQSLIETLKVKVYPR
jgi:hypothetical protein